MGKQKLLSVTAKDCRWDYYRGSGNGGQKKNKTDNCARCTHEPSGAVGKAEDGRSKEHNRHKAFERMANTSEFQKWLKIELCRVTGELALIEEKVDNHLRSAIIETKDDKGRWRENPDLSLTEWDIENLKD